MPEPRYETRWHIKGTWFHFAHERQARAFALPGQTVVPIQRPVYSTKETLEFLFGDA